jgi:hypothetical protein
MSLRRQRASNPVTLDPPLADVVVSDRDRVQVD